MNLKSTMKALTLTAIVGVLVAIPFIVARRSHTLVPVRLTTDKRATNENLLYDVNDFIEAGS